VLQLTLLFTRALACLQPKLFPLILCDNGVVLITKLLVTFGWNVYFYGRMMVGVMARMESLLVESKGF
jgi:hypothetical protein